MASKEELLQSIQPGMRLDKAFFSRIYGYEISFPGFSETALAVLEDAGCSKARAYYDQIVGEYQDRRDLELKEAASWYIEEMDKRKKKNSWKEGEEQREQRNSSGEKLKKNLNELLERENKLKQLLRKVQSQ